MADETITRRVCDVARCDTPYDDVRRIESTLEGEGTVLMDLCKSHRAPVMELRRHAHRSIRPKRVRVVEPEEVRKR